MKRKMQKAKIKNAPSTAADEVGYPDDHDDNSAVAW